MRRERVEDYAEATADGLSTGRRAGVEYDRTTASARSTSPMVLGKPSDARTAPTGMLGPRHSARRSMLNSVSEI